MSDGLRVSHAAPMPVHGKGPTWIVRSSMLLLCSSVTFSLRTLAAALIAGA
jgi:hypothetical protein